MISILITSVSGFTYKQVCLVGCKSQKKNKLSISKDRRAFNSAARNYIDRVKATATIYTFSSALSPDTCRAVRGQKKRCYLCYLHADIILYTVYVEVGTKLSVCVI